MWQACYFVTGLLCQNLRFQASKWTEFGRIGVIGAHVIVTLIKEKRIGQEKEPAQTLPQVVLESEFVIRVTLLY